ncbi:MAG: peptidase M17, partial [Pseudonocardiaceae bacterium]
MGPGSDVLGVDERWLTQYRVRATAGSVHVVPLATARPDHGWLLGIGQGGVQHWRAAGGALIRATSTRVAGDAVARPRASRTVQVHLPPGTTAHQAAALALGCVVGSHRYRFASGDRPPWTTTVRLVAPPGHDPQPLASAVARAQVLGHATGLARD